MGNYFNKKANEAHEGVARRAQEAHEGIDRRVNGKRPDAKNTPQYKNGGEGSSTSEQPKSTTKAVGKAAAASSELFMVSLYSAASALGAVAAASLLGKRGLNN